MIKRLFLIPFAVTALLTTSSIFAEDQATTDTPKPRAGAHAPGDRLKNLTEKLGLTDEQQTKIKAIFDANAPKLKEIRSDKSIARPEKRKELVEIRKSEFEQIRAVLTPEQQQKLKDLRGNRRGKKGAGAAA